MESLRVALGERSYPIHIGAGLLIRPDLYRPYLAGGSAAIINGRNEFPFPIPVANATRIACKTASGLSK